MKLLFLIIPLVLCSIDPIEDNVKFHLTIRSIARGSKEYGCTTTKMEIYDPYTKASQSYKMLVSTLATYSWIPSVFCTSCGKGKRISEPHNRCDLIKIFHNGLYIQGFSILVTFDFKNIVVNQPIIAVSSMLAYGAKLEFDGVLGLGKDFTQISNHFIHFSSVAETILLGVSSYFLLYFNFDALSPFFAWIDYDKELDSGLIWLNFYDLRKMALVMKGIKLVWLNNAGNEVRSQYLETNCVDGCELYIDTASYYTYAPPRFVDVKH